MIAVLMSVAMCAMVLGNMLPSFAMPISKVAGGENKSAIGSGE